MIAVPVAPQKGVSPLRFPTDHVSGLSRLSTSRLGLEQWHPATPEGDINSQAGTILADYPSDERATRPLKFAVPLDQTYPKHSGKSIYYTGYSLPLEFLFRDHVQAAIAVPPEIISELDAVQDDAVEEGFPVPSADLVEDVRRLLAKVYQIAPNLPYMIYPMEQGEIAIHVSNEPTGIVLLLCHETETWCVASIGDSPRRAWFRDRDGLPEAFVREALATLKSGVAW